MFYRMSDDSGKICRSLDRCAGDKNRIRRETEGGEGTKIDTYRPFVCAVPPQPT